MEMCASCVKGSKGVKSKTEHTNAKDKAFSGPVLYADAL